MISWHEWRREPRTAAEWFARVRSGEISPASDARFREWLAADPQNELEYERQELAWELSGDLDGDREIEALAREAEAEASSRGATGRVNGRAHALPAWGAAAAALLILAIGVVFWSSNRPSDELHTTAIGERRMVVLPDQSRMTLNTATRVRVAYARSLRAIVLEQGEATFTVAHDPDHPFEVRAAAGTVRALGTTFNVLEGNGDVTVSVLQGKVDVVTPARGAAGNHTLLSGGQEVSYSARTISKIRAGDTARIQAWHSGRILFQDVSLGEAIVQFNRYSRTELVLGDASLASRRVTGTFRVGETGAFLTALREAFGVRAVARGSSIVLWPPLASPPQTVN